jgi:hypothetical protein
MFLVGWAPAGPAVATRETFQAGCQVRPSFRLYAQVRLKAAYIRTMVALVLETPAIEGARTDLKDTRAR